MDSFGLPRELWLHAYSNVYFLALKYLNRHLYGLEVSRYIEVLGCTIAYLMYMKIEISRLYHCCCFTGSFKGTSVFLVNNQRHQMHTLYFVLTVGSVIA
jgi:hypothetical protein